MERFGVDEHRLKEIDKSCLQAIVDILALKHICYDPLGKTNVLNPPDRCLIPALTDAAEHIQNRSDVKVDLPHPGLVIAAHQISKFE